MESHKIHVPKHQPVHFSVNLALFYGYQMLPASSGNHRSLIRSDSSFAKRDSSSRRLDSSLASKPGLFFGEILGPGSPF
jgi:hypothetical protein